MQALTTGASLGVCGSSTRSHARAQAEHERVQSALFDARQAREEADTAAAPSAADLAAEERDALALRIRCALWDNGTSSGAQEVSLVIVGFLQCVLAGGAACSLPGACMSHPE